jgi:hypothetical protein
MPPAKAPANQSYRLGKNNKDAEGFEEWDAQKLSEYFKKAGVGEYGEMFITHKITGRLAPLLTDLDLKEMGKSNHFLDFPSFNGNKSDRSFRLDSFRYYDCRRPSKTKEHYHSARAQGTL